MPSFQRPSFSLIEVQMNCPTFLLGSQGPFGSGGQERSSVFGYLSCVSLNQSGGVEPTFLINACTSSRDFSAASRICGDSNRMIERRSFTRALENWMSQELHQPWLRGVHRHFCGWLPIQSPGSIRARK